MITERTNTQLTRKQKITIGIAGICLLACLYAAAPFAFADGAAVINGVVQVVCKICTVVGVLFAIVGIVKFVISHANEDGPAQQKAALMIATGVVLVILGSTNILGIDFASWLG